MIGIVIAPSNISILAISNPRENSSRNCNPLSSIPSRASPKIFPPARSEVEAKCFTESSFVEKESSPIDKTCSELINTGFGDERSAGSSPTETTISSKRHDAQSPNLLSLIKGMALSAF